MDTDKGGGFGGRGREGKEGRDEKKVWSGCFSVPVAVLMLLAALPPRLLSTANLGCPISQAVLAVGQG